MANPVSLVVGVGPGLGIAVAKRFGQAGYDVALVSRSENELVRLGRALEADGITTGWAAVDITNVESFEAAVQRFGDHAGELSHIHFNPSVGTPCSPLELTAARLLNDVHVGVGALLTTVHAARPYLRSGARITATGSRIADRPWAKAASLGVQKAGLRNLVTALDTSLKDEDIRAVTVTVNGTIEEGGRFDPVHVAEAIYAASRQSAGAWQTEVVFNGKPA